jgi:hypothetical protein
VTLLTPILHPSGRGGAGAPFFIFSVVVIHLRSPEICG